MFKFVGALVLLGFSAYAGYDYAHFRAPKPDAPLAVIGLGACGKWLGGIVITQDGKPHPSNDLTEEQAGALVKMVPHGNDTMAMAPCVLGGGKDT